MPSRTHRSTGSFSDYSDGSIHSRSTAPTEHSVHHDSGYGDLDFTSCPADNCWDTGLEKYYLSKEIGPRGSYASTVASDLDDLDESPLYAEPEQYFDEYIPTVQPSTPATFAQLFPSTRRITIQHDNTIDGNMNLRLDTQTVASDGDKIDLTLFHLRMHELKSREFSFRRYCRDSGREVCHSSRKYTKPAPHRRPGLQRSVSNAWSSLLSKAETKPTSTKSSLQRKDSGYDTMSDDEDEFQSHHQSTSDRTSMTMPSNTMKLEFANYAHVDLKRRGTRYSKRYDFEYWGKQYHWKRVAKKEGSGKGVSFHLHTSDYSDPIAHIVPVLMTPSEEAEEEQKGGWVHPSSIWISNESFLGGSTDVADVIVVTGLMALVDDTIKTRWQSKDRFQFTLPLPHLSTHSTTGSKSRPNPDYVTPKQLIDEMFRRRPSGEVIAPAGGRA